MSLAASLGSTHDAAIGERVRAYALSEAIKLGEGNRLLGVYRAQPENRQAYWTWVQAHYDDVIKRMSGPSRGKLPEMMGQGHCEAKQADELAAFFDKRMAQVAGGAQSLARASEEIRLCAVRREHQDAKALATWLAAQK
jgi:alanyl aminopeptidase